MFHGGRRTGRTVLVTLALVMGCGGDDTSTTGTESDAGTDTDVSTTSTTDASTSTTDATSGTTTSTSTDGSTGSTGMDTDTDTGTGGVNSAPEPLDDFYLTDTASVPLAVDAASGVLANDDDPEQDTLSVDSFDGITTAGGTVTVDDDGAFTYTPPAGHYGDDRFGYVVTDGADTASAEVRIMVAPTAESLATAGLVIDGEAAGDRSGFGVGGRGDIDGDGDDDVVIGANDADGSTADVGKVYAVFTSAGAVALGNVADGTEGFEMIGSEADTLTGESVALLGDVNGDGLADIGIGAPDEGGAGRAYVVFGKASGVDVPLSTLAADANGFVIEGASAGDLMGQSVGAAGDVNGDGLADIIVGGPQDQPETGFAVVVFGKTSTDPVDISALGSAGFSLAGEGSFDLAGISVFGAGDVNGDGIDDLVVGAEFADPGGGQSGRAYVVFGRTADTDVALSAVAGGTGGFAIDGEAASDQAGGAVAGAGDVNGDGRADVIVGAIGYGDPDGLGRAYVVFGKTNTTAVSLATIAAGTGGFAMTGEAQFNFAGSSVAGAGDVNGDGLADVVVGASNASFGAGQAGRAYVVYGRTSTAAIALSDVALGQGGFALDGEAVATYAGWAVAGAGDVNGDGFADVLVGAYGTNTSAGTDAGRSYVAYGGDYTGLTDGAATDGDDAIVGTTGGDVLIGGRGADDIQGGGGNDILYGGAGDDVITLEEGNDFFRIDGGNGVDTLAIAGADTVLDLTGVADLAVVGIETIDITGSGDNELVLGLRDLRALSATSNTLLVLGDQGDELTADVTGGGFTNEGSDGTQTTWSNGVLTLIVDDDVAATGLP